VKVYLDASALNRPFDDQQLARNRLETEAVLAILEWIESGELKLVGSAALVYENRMSPLVERREYVATYLDLAATFVTADPALLDRAKAIEAQGIKPLDALHLASAERGRAEWFVTCDDRILKRARRGKLGIRGVHDRKVMLAASRGQGGLGAAFPEVLEATAELVAAQRNDGVGTSEAPVHGGPLETMPDGNVAA